jgi:hypothetical protein
MAKRLSREQKWEKASVDLINEMFSHAGHDVTFEDVIGRQDAWYTDWEMTVAQHEAWKKWGKKYLMKNLGLLSATAEKEMSWFSLMYGLKFSDPETLNLL